MTCVYVFMLVDAFFHSAVADLSGLNELSILTSFVVGIWPGKDGAAAFTTALACIPSPCEFLNLLGGSVSRQGVRL
jgi:hypothetical protein